MKPVLREQLVQAQTLASEGLEEARAHPGDASYASIAEFRAKQSAALVLAYNAQPVCPFCGPVGRLVEVPTKGVLVCDACKAIALVGTQAARVIVVGEEERS